MFYGSAWETAALPGAGVGAWSSDKYSQLHDWYTSPSSNNNSTGKPGSGFYIGESSCYATPHAGAFYYDHDRPKPEQFVTPRYDN
jgi:hypothetical protein